MARPRSISKVPTPDLHEFAFEDEVEFSFRRRPMIRCKGYFFADGYRVPSICRPATGREQSNRYHRLSEVIPLRVWRNGVLVAQVAGWKQTPGPKGIT